MKHFVSLKQCYHQKTFDIVYNSVFLIKYIDNIIFSVDPKQNKKKKRETDVEAFEESDDGDGEGRELDYISDSTDSEPENINLDSVAEEKALRYTS